VLLEDSAQSTSQKNSVPWEPSRRRDISSGCPTVQSIIYPDNKNFPFRPSSVSRSFELLQLASDRTFQQHVWTTLSVRLTTRFLSKTKIWEDRYNRLDVVDFRSDEFINKASIAFTIQTSGHQYSWSGRVSIIYESCVHQINRLNDNSFGPDARSLGIKITCSGSATIQTIGQHGPDAAQNMKEFQWNFWKADRTIVRPDALWLLSGRHLGFIKPDAHLN